MKIGIGTYSFGGMASYLGLGPSLLEKLQTIKALGYETVELLPTDLEYDIEDIKKWLAETGIEVTSIHADPTEDIIKAMAALGGKAVICAMTNFANKAEAIEVAQWLDEMAEIAEPYGIKVAYHNHSQEFWFDEGQSLLEHLLDNSSKCFVQLDCGWSMDAGMYPPYFIRKYRNRILSIHVKENCKVNGPTASGAPVSRHAPPAADDPISSLMAMLANAKSLPIEERQQMLSQMEAMMATEMAGMDVQCKMGAPESNIDWTEVKKALDEQDFEAFWVVEREAFYDEHDKCIAEDCAWLKENIK